MADDGTTKHAIIRFADEILGPVSLYAGAEGHGRSWRVKELIPSPVLNPVDHLRDFMEKPHIIFTRTSEMIHS